MIEFWQTDLRWRKNRIKLNRIANSLDRFENAVCEPPTLGLKAIAVQPKDSYGIVIVAAYERLRRSLSVVGVVERRAKRIFPPHLQHSLCGEAARVLSEKR